MKSFTSNEIKKLESLEGKLIPNKDFFREIYNCFSNRNIDVWNTGFSKRNGKKSLCITSDDIDLVYELEFRELGADYIEVAELLN